MKSARELINEQVRKETLKEMGRKKSVEPSSEETPVEVTDPKVKALMQHLDINDPDEISASTYDESTFETPEGEYRVLTDEEADVAVEEYISDSVWAFNASFLASHMDDVDEELITTV